MMKLTVGRGHRAATTVARRLAHVPAAAAGRLRVDDKLKAFVDDELLPGTSVAPSKFWDGLSSILEDMAPRNRALLDRRDELQAQLDAWHRANPGTPDPTAYAALLESSGYLAPAAPPFEVCSQHVDPELALVAGPQLVCPVDNARFIVNAANARWGSLLDAIYGTDVLPGDRAGEKPPRRQHSHARTGQPRYAGQSEAVRPWPLPAQHTTALRRASPPTRITSSRRRPRRQAHTSPSGARRRSEWRTACSTRDSRSRVKPRGPM